MSPNPSDPHGPTISEATTRAALNGSPEHLKAIAATELPHGYSIDVLKLFLWQLRLYPEDTVHIDEEPLNRKIECVLVTFKLICDSLPRCLELFPELRTSTVGEITCRVPELVAWMTCAVREPIYAGHDGHTSGRISRAIFGPGVLGARPLGSYQTAPFELSNRQTMQQLHRASVLTMRRLMELDASLKIYLMGFYSSIQALLVMWILKIDGEPVMDSSSLLARTKLSRPDNLSIVHPDLLIGNLHSFLLSGASRANIQRAITQESVCPASVFITSTLRRVQAATSSIKKRQTVAFGAGNFWELIQITGYLMLSAPTIQELFIRHGLIPTFIEGLMALRHDLPNDDKTRLTEVIPQLITFGSQIFAWTAYFSGSLMTNLSVLVKSGALHLIVESFTYSSDKPKLTPPGHPRPTASEICSRFDLENISSNATNITGQGTAIEGAFMLSTLFRYTKYPRFLPELRRQMAAIPSSEINVLSENDERRILYEALLEAVSERTEFVKRTRRTWTCDNLGHHTTFSAPSPSLSYTRIRSRKQQTCSKCHSVTYCSKECQKQDWGRRHRLECPSDHNLYLHLKHDNQWYSHSTRAFHLSLVLDVCEDVFGRDSESRSESDKAGSPAPSTSTSNPFPMDDTSHPDISTASTKYIDTGARENVLTLYHPKPFKVRATEYIWIFKFDKPEMQERIPFKGWIENNGRWVRPWLKPRLTQILEMWRSSNSARHRASSARASLDYQQEGTELRPIRHLADAQFDLGHLTGHLLILLRKRSGLEGEGGRPVGKGSEFEYGYDIEASLAFFVPKVQGPLTVLHLIQGLTLLLMRNCNARSTACLALGVAILALTWFWA